MDVIGGLVRFIVEEILSVPAFLVGLIVLLGLLALRKPAGEIIGGTLKAILGFVILGVGATAVVGALQPLGTMILEVFNAQGVVPTNEAITAIAAGEFGTTVAWVMLLGFIVNLVLARLTPMKYIFLTGHHILFMATMLAVVMSAAGIVDVPNIIVSGILLGTIMVVMPALGQPFMRRITNDQPVAIGHFGTAGYILAGLAGKLVGGRSKSTEEMSFPKTFNFLRDAMVATAVAMIVIYVIFAVWYSLSAGPEAAAEISGGGDLVVFGITQALTFAAGVAVILLGVRTILGEIVPAFAGIGSRIVPDALPALDCPITFPFAPNAVIIGFLASFAGGLVSLGILAATGGLGMALALILPGMVPHFFTGGTAGVFGNATGGRLGAVIGGFINGVFITFGAAFLLPVMGELGFANTTFGDADFQWFGIVVGNVARLGVPMLYIGLAVVVVLLLALAWWVQSQLPKPTYDADAQASAEPSATKV
ncbi:MAG TPA: PTS ascorbate transporter subunit IIC [Candidatus Limnocylindria bacterium]|nr:PTS ascorbate transporter subunit IIC [Candidatus Limnocylindria bacterium]